MVGHVFISTTGNGLARAALGNGGEWRVEQLLPGTDVRCLSADPLNAGRVYAGTQGAGVLRSDDEGRTWRPAGLAGKIVKAMAASPSQPGVVYAGTKPAHMFISRDGGQSWTELRSFRLIPWKWLWFSPAETPFIGYVQAIAPSPTDPDRVVVGIEAGATVLTRDGGKTWTRHRKGALRDCHSLKFHATSGDWVYEGGGTGGGVSFSRDAGRTWTQPKEGLDRHYGWAVAADPEQPDIWYASLSPGPVQAHNDGNAQAYIFRRDGSSCRRLGGGLPQPLSHMPYELLTTRGAPGHVWAGLSNGEIFHSADCGEEWQQMPFSLGGIHRSLVML